MPRLRLVAILALLIVPALTTGGLARPAGQGASAAPPAAGRDAGRRGDPRRLGAAAPAGRDGVAALATTPAASPVASPAATPTTAPLVPLAALLPGADEVPAGLVPGGDDRRSADQVAAQLAGPGADGAARAAASAQLTGWGFGGAVGRQYFPAQGQATGDGGIRWLWVVAYRFRDATPAAAAYDAFTAVSRATDGMRQVSVSKLGDQTQALARPGGDRLFHLWLRTGGDVIWIGGTAKAGFPRDQVEAVARAVLAREAGAAIGGEGTAVASPAAGPPITVGANVVTTDEANLRAEPSTTASVVAVLPPGTSLVVTGPSVTADGHTWWPVQVAGGNQTGYVAADLLAVAQ